MDQKPTLTLHDVAERLSMKDHEFQQRRGRMQREYHFPRALPGCGNVWSTRLVDAWIDAGGSCAVHAHSPAPIPDGWQAAIDADRKKLEEQYASSD